MLGRDARPARVFAGRIQRPTDRRQHPLRRWKRLRPVGAPAPTIVNLTAALETGAAQPLNIDKRVTIFAEPAFGASVIDNFNRADEGPPMTGWTDIDTGFQVIANKAAPSDSGGINSAYWNTAMTSRDVEVFVTLDVEPDSGGETHLFARLDPTAPKDGYRLTLDHWGPGVIDSWRLEYLINNVSFDIFDDTPRTWGSGDKVGLRCLGREISVWHLPVGGRWVRLAVATDANISGASPTDKLGLHNFQPGLPIDERYDDFGGGVLTPFELDTAVALDKDKRVSLTPAVETDTALALSLGGPKSLVPAVETDSSRVLVITKIKTLVPCLETDSARVLSFSTGSPIFKALVAALESSRAMDLYFDRCAHFAFSAAPEISLSLSPASEAPLTLTPATEAELTLTGKDCC